MTNFQHIVYALDSGKYTSECVAKYIAGMLYESKIAYLNEKDIKKLIEWMDTD